MVHEFDQTAFRLEFRSDPFAVRDALAKARVAWTGWGLGTETCATAEQVLAEVLNNVVEHAHQEDPDGAVVLISSIKEGGLHIEVRDDGREMPGARLPKGELSELTDNFDDLPEGGFGWFMIRTLTQDLTYRRVGDWNCLTFRMGSDS